MSRNNLPGKTQISKCFSEVKKSFLSLSLPPLTSCAIQFWAPPPTIPLSLVDPSFSCRLLYI